MRNYALMAATAMAVALAAPAAAVQYRFVVVDPHATQGGQPLDNNSYFFDADSSPSPSFSNGFSFTIPTTISYRVTVSGGAFSDYRVLTDIMFFNDQSGGGFDAGGAFSAFSGPQLFTGDAATPMFKFGGPFNFAGDVTVNISQVPSAVPEAASWALMIAGFGLVGTALRVRRPARVRFA